MFFLIGLRKYLDPHLANLSDQISQVERHLKFRLPTFFELNNYIGLWILRPS